MNLQDQINLVEKLDQLIRLKATGTPKALAVRLKMSERHLYRLIDEMKAMGFPIAYSKRRQSYYYEKPVLFSFEICIIEEQEKRKIKGGEFFFQSFSQTDRIWQCGGPSLWQLANERETLNP